MGRGPGAVMVLGGGGAALSLHQEQDGRQDARAVRP